MSGVELVLPSHWDSLERVRYLQGALLRMAADWRIAAWARALAAQIAPERLSREERRAALLAWVQSLPYVPDPPGKDVVRSPARTAREGGECKERSLLLGLLMMVALGASVELLWIPQKPAPLDHVSLVEWESPTEMVWLDATVPGARVGEVPGDAAERVGDRVGPDRGVFR